MATITIKLLRWAQKAGEAGWNKHVNPWLRRKANKKLRNYYKKDTNRI